MRRARPPRPRPQPRRHPLIVGPDRDYRGKVICERCGSTEDASVHVLPERSEEEKAIEDRRVGER